MKQMINTVVTDMLTALYQPFMFAVVLAVFFMFLYMYANYHEQRKEDFQKEFERYIIDGLLNGVPSRACA